MTEPIEQAGRTGAQECRDTERVCGPLQAGAQITVYRVAMIQRPLVEGTAIVLSAFDEARDLYWVRFAGEAVPRVRLVHSGSWQSEPDTTLCALLAHWREAHALEAFGPFLSDDGLSTRDGR